MARVSCAWSAISSCRVRIGNPCSASFAQYPDRHELSAGTAMRSITEPGAGMGSVLSMPPMPAPVSHGERAAAGAANRAATACMHTHDARFTPPDRMPTHTVQNARAVLTSRWCVGTCATCSTFPPHSTRTRSAACRSKPMASSCAPPPPTHHATRTRAHARARFRGGAALPTHGRLLPGGS